MILKNVPFSLYSKIALWLVLNLVLLVVLGFGIGRYVLLGNGLVPAHFFSSNIENSFRLCLRRTAPMLRVARRIFSSIRALRSADCAGAFPPDLP